jgi:ATP-dependent RNA helicase HelY
MQCHLGDAREYFGIRRELTDLERTAAKRDDSAGRGERERRERQITSLRKRLRRHPVHGCSDRDQHARWAERYFRLKKDHDRMSSQISGRTGAVAKVFDRVSEVLSELGYLVVDEEGRTALSVHGRALRRIYGERDLLVAECLRRNVWKDLDAASLAALASAIVYQPRRDEGQTHERFLPRGPFLAAFEQTGDLWAKLDDLERAHHLPGSDPLAAGLSLAMWRWARGGRLDSVLSDADLAAGDFVRWAKQTIDLLDQLSLVAHGRVGSVARDALLAVRRGIVAHSSVG